RAWDYIRVIAIAAPDIITTALPLMTEDVAYSTTIAAEDGTTPITWSVTAGALPAGLTFNSAGVLDGTPTTAGVYDFTVTATNSVGTDTRQFTGIIFTPGSSGTLLWADEFDSDATETNWTGSNGDVVA